jgi:hypothetical protein
MLVLPAAAWARLARGDAADQEGVGNFETAMATAALTARAWIADTAAVLPVATGRLLPPLPSPNAFPLLGFDVGQIAQWAKRAKRYPGRGAKNTSAGAEDKETGQGIKSIGVHGNSLHSDRVLVGHNGAKICGAEGPYSASERSAAPCLRANSPASAYP